MRLVFYPPQEDSTHYSPERLPPPAQAGKSCLLSYRDSRQETSACGVRQDRHPGNQSIGNRDDRKLPVYPRSVSFQLAHYDHGQAGSMSHY